MLPFVIRRILISIPLLAVSSFLVFIMVANAGDPLQDLRVNPRISAATIAAREDALNLNDPVITRYFKWAGDIITGDFGQDNRSQEVWPQLTRALGVTLRLVVAALIVSVALGLFVGVISALKQYSAVDYTFTFASFLFFSLPVFWLAALLKEYAAIRFNDLVGSTWIYTQGQQSPNLSGGFWSRMGDYAGHTFLPAITLILIAFALYSRYTRASMLDTLNSDYVRTAKAKGISQRRVVMRHALRNAMIPVTTVVALDFGAIIGGAVITERVFNWDGMGTLLIEGVTQFDTNMVLAFLMITAVGVVFFNLLADLIYAYLDPRIRLD